MTIATGDAAPTFDLPGTDDTDEGRRNYTLAEFRGRPVVLVFYPGDGTPVCTRQLNAYTRDIDSFESVGAQVLAVSPQSVESHESFSCKQGGFSFPLLADVDKELGKAYGIIGPLGLYRRSAFVIDGEGVVRYVHRALAGLTFRPTAELVAAVAAASA
ncbi:MAG: peroxiredoxin [Actinomycetota bacterium]|nr:peroxiredoxin [Acidimicrobiia bacterium]MDQ3293213.1 peroxiredoxin [Actinomycetota bacterium]